MLSAASSSEDTQNLVRGLQLMFEMPGYWVVAGVVAVVMGLLAATKAITWRVAAIAYFIVAVPPALMWFDVYSKNTRRGADSQGLVVAGMLVSSATT